MLFISIMLMIALVACGAGQPAAETNSACGSVGQQMLNSVGEGYLFPDASSGPNNLTVNEGSTMALGSGDFVLYRADINSNGPTYLFGETLDRQGIKITAYQCGDDVGFDIDIFPLQTFAELMLLQSDTNWDAWSQAIKEVSYDVSGDFVSINVGVVNQTTGKLMSIPAGLIIPHNEGWVNPPAQQEGEVTTFHVQENQAEGAVSRIEYVPQPGWELKDTINETASDGSQFVIYVVSPTVSVIDLTPFGYKGPISRLLASSYLVDGGSNIAMSGIKSLNTGDEFLLPDGNDSAEKFMLMFPVSPYDDFGMAEYLLGFDPITTSAGVYCTGYTDVGGYNYHYTFNVYEGSLNFYFEICK